ncbi:MAG: RNHCP domain-containing protein [Planctomycetota bacterium]|nr:RNHCP domain-containing protein [Planctomycetota bacterium]
MPGERRNFIGTGNDGFTCEHCGLEVLPLARASYRNHCPRCLWSRHVDDAPGDRAASCGGLMEPVELSGSTSVGWTILHRCTVCGARRPNRAAVDDRRQPDDWERLLELAGGRSERRPE